MNESLKHFFYLLLRDELPAGQVEKLMRQMEDGRGLDLKYSNKHVEGYASELANRMLKPAQP